MTAHVVEKGRKMCHADWLDCLAVYVMHCLLETCARRNRAGETRSMQVVYLVVCKDALINRFLGESVGFPASCTG